jgi:hypothetical protein
MRMVPSVRRIAATFILLIALSACQQAPAETDITDSLPSAEVGDPEADAVVTRAAISADGSTFTSAGYVSGTTEDGGTCTFLITDGTTRLELSTTGVADATTTTCPEVTVPAADLNPGAWTVVLNYISDSRTLASEPLALEIL